MHSIDLAEKVYAGIVLYFPDKDKLHALVNSLLKQVNHVFLYDNGGSAEAIRHLREFQGSFQVLGTGKNNGIGIALNEMINYSKNYNANFFWTFDQDSLPDSNLLNAMLKIISLNNLGEKVAAYSPAFVDKRGNVDILPIFRLGRFFVKKIKPVNNCEKTETDIMITSGMLLSVQEFSHIGDYREDFFIDHVDTEWCLRAKKLGYKLYTLPGCVMKHELSEEKPKRLFGRLLLKYSPLRRYYQFRNTVYLAIYGDIPFSLRMYFVATIAYRLILCTLTDSNGFESFKYMNKGIADGLMKKLGPI